MRNSRKLAKTENVNHVSEEAVARYVVRLARQQITPVEEQLLPCSEYHDRLETMGRYVGDDGSAATITTLRHRARAIANPQWRPL